MRKVLFVIVTCATLALGQVPAGAIVGGQLDGNRHPEVGALIGTSPFTGQTGAYCSGTLISPTVFLTAAHCGFGPPQVRVTFDSAYTSRSKLYSGTFHPHPEYTSAYGDSADVAVVVFAEAVKGITPATLPSAGLLDRMKADGSLNQSTRFTSVGYGDQEYVNGPGGQSTTSDSTRRFAVGAFNSLNATRLHISQNSTLGDGGTCYGDSGGPNFLGAGTTETDVIAGVTVTGDNFCSATNVDYRLDIATARNFLGQFVPLP